MKFSQIAVAASLAVASAGAFATTFTATSYNLGNKVDATLDGVDRADTQTAEIIGTVDTFGNGSFAAFCIELDAGFLSPLSGALGSLGAKADALSQLFTGAGWSSWDYANDGVASDDKVKIAALQVGVWEIIYDTTFDLSTGSFTVGAGDQAAYGDLISGWMKAGNPGLGNSIFALSDADTGANVNQQDVLIAVPEPSTYALMIAGLGAVGFVARRRARRG
jgi:hypothetical protein